MRKNKASCYDPRSQVQWWKKQDLCIDATFFFAVSRSCGNEKRGADGQKDHLAIPVDLNRHIWSKETFETNRALARKPSCSERITTPKWCQNKPVPVRTDMNGRCICPSWAFVQCLSVGVFLTDKGIRTLKIINSCFSTCGPLSKRRLAGCYQCFHVHQKRRPARINMFLCSRQKGHQHNCGAQNPFWGRKLPSLGVHKGRAVKPFNVVLKTGTHMHHWYEPCHSTMMKPFVQQMQLYCAGYRSCGKSTKTHQHAVPCCNDTSFWSWTQSSGTTKAGQNSSRGETSTPRQRKGRAPPTVTWSLNCPQTQGLPVLETRALYQRRGHICSIWHVCSGVGGVWCCPRRRPQRQGDSDKYCSAR